MGRIAEYKVREVNINDEHVDILPKENEFVIVSDKNGPNFCYFICPCGCGSAACIDVVKIHTLTRSGAKFTVRASVLCSPCGAHFYFTDNKVEWC